MNEGRRCKKQQKMRNCVKQNKKPIPRNGYSPSYWTTVSRDDGFYQSLLVFMGYHISLGRKEGLVEAFKV